MQNFITPISFNYFNEGIKGYRQYAGSRAGLKCNDFFNTIKTAFPLQTEPASLRILMDDYSSWYGM